VSYLDLLRSRPYRLLFSGQVLSQFGDAVYEAGIVWLVYEMSGSAAALGLLALCQSVPFLLLGVFAGAYVDRWDRRKTMLASDLVRGLAALYLFLRWISGGLTVWEICVLAVVLTAARAFFHPALRGILPQMLPREQLLLANSLNEAAKRITKVLGLTLGGVLVASENGGAMLFLNAATFFLSLGTLAMMREVRREGSEASRPAGIWRDVGAAGAVMFRDWGVLLMVGISSIGLIVSAGMIKIGLPLLAAQVPGGDGDLYGLLMACFSLGMFAAAWGIKKLRRFSVLLLVPLGWCLYGLSFLGFANLPFVWLALAAAVAGFAHFLTDIPVTTLIQQRMPLGRMSACQSIWATVSFGSESLSVAVTGLWLGALFPAFLGTGALLLFLGLAPLIILRKSGQNRVDSNTSSQ